MKVHRITKREWLLWIPALVACGCSNTKFLPEGKALLVKHRVEFTKPDTVSDSRSIESGLLRATSQQPNEKMLGIARVRLWLWNRTDTNQRVDTIKGLRKSLHEKGGEPPVIFDSVEAGKSVVAMQDYLFDHGYFHGKVSFTVDYDSSRHTSKGSVTYRQKATVVYHVTRGELSYIDSVIYEIEDERINRFKDEGIAKSPLKSGKPYDVDDMKRERTRITTILRDWGYRDFATQYIYFEADTLSPGKDVTLYVKLAPPPEDSVHRVWYIGNIYVYPDSSAGASGHDTIKKEDVYILYRGKLRYKPQALVNPIFMRAGALYSYDKYLRTLRRFSELDAFQFVTIQFVNDRDSLGRHRVCDVVIELTPAQRRNFEVSVTANSASDAFKGIGSEVNVSFRSRNLFRFTDVLNISASGGVEAGLDTTTNEFRLSTLDFNAELSIEIPKWVMPPLNPKTRRVPKTRVSYRFNYLRRLDLYDFRSHTFGYTGEYQDNPNNRWNGGFYFLLSGVLNSTPRFQSILDDNPTLRRSFESIRIVGVNVGFSYTNQAKPQRKTPHIFYGRFIFPFELGYAIADDHSAWFFKQDAEAKRLWILSKHVQLPLRITAGVAVPTGSDGFIPYIKQFVIGGANSIRAWRVRTIGPGEYDFAEDPDTNKFLDQSGDIKLEANIECRFDLLWWLKGAVFLDMGNIWLIKPNPELPGGEFTSNFYTQFALGTGLGFRLDFDFFIVRFDLGMKLRYPTGGGLLPKGIQFGMPDWREEQLHLNIGIGYPF